MKSLILYTLITVTSSGAIYHSDGYKSVHDCLEAKNLAVSGKTIEKQAADEAKAKADEKARERAWATAHPPRPPSTQLEKQAIEQAHKYAVNGEHCTPDYNAFHVTKDFLIQDDGPNPFNYCGDDSHNYVTFMNSTSPNITTAECVIEVK